MFATLFSYLFVIFGHLTVNVIAFLVNHVNLVMQIPAKLLQQNSLHKIDKRNFTQYRIFFWVNDSFKFYKRSSMIHLNNLIVPVIPGLTGRKN